MFFNNYNIDIELFTGKNWKQSDRAFLPLGNNHFNHL